MAGSVNKVILIGNLGNDPDIRQTQDGRSICNLSVATTENWRDKQSGEKRERTEWHRVVIFNEQLCKIAQQYLKKGAKVYLEGQLQTRKWQDNAGQERYTTEIVLQNYAGQLTMLDSRGAGGGGASMGGYDGFQESPQMGYDAQPGFSSPPRGREASSPKSFSKDLDDEIPF